MIEECINERFINENNWQIYQWNVCLWEWLKNISMKDLLIKTIDDFIKKEFINENGWIFYQWNVC